MKAMQEENGVATPPRFSLWFNQLLPHAYVTGRAEHGPLFGVVEQ